MDSPYTIAGAASVMGTLESLIDISSSGTSVDNVHCVRAASYRRLSYAWHGARRREPSLPVAAGRWVDLVCVAGSRRRVGRTSYEVLRFPEGLIQRSNMQIKRHAMISIA